MVSLFKLNFGNFDLTAGDNSNDHFQLETLCCDEVLDLSRIITSQTELQKLGIYEKDLGFLRTLKELQNTQLHLPVVFSLEYHYHGPELPQKISIFPPFYDCHPSIHQVLAETFGTDQDSYTRKIDTLSIYLVDSCDLPSIQVLTKNMTMTFPNLTSLTFSFENPCEQIVSFLFDRSLS